MKKIALNGLLISLALVLSFVERFIPLNLIVPLPGVKLGLANIVSMFSLFYLGISSTLSIIVIRCTLGSLMFGGMSSFLYSLAGALFSLIAMSLLKSGYDRVFSIAGISMGGAAAHNTGQLVMASIIMKDAAIFAYLPVLLITGLITGLFIAFVSVYLFAIFEKTKIVTFIK